MTNRHTEKRIRITVVGDGDTGKTSMLIAYKDKKFSEHYIPTVFDSYSMTVPINGEDYVVILSDTAGQEEYDRLRPLAYKDTDVFIICFSVENRTSFHNVKNKWYPEVKHYRPRSKIVLVGTKCDLREYSQKYVNTLEGKAMMQQLHAVNYIECSAKLMKDIDKVFEVAMTSVFTIPEKRRKTNCTIV